MTMVRVRLSLDLFNIKKQNNLSKNNDTIVKKSYRLDRNIPHIKENYFNFFIKN